MTEISKGAWNPRPADHLSASARNLYFAGYSDGYHGYPFGSGDDGSIDNRATYRPGYNDGIADAKPCKES